VFFIAGLFITNSFPTEELETDPDSYDAATLLPAVSVTPIGVLVLQARRLSSPAAIP
jgi:hypothetical protein